MGFSRISSIYFFGSAFGKLIVDEKGLADALGFGINFTNYMYLSIIEIIAVILFLIPRTSIIGSLLLIVYMGGAIATHLKHSLPIIVLL